MSWGGIAGTMAGAVGLALCSGRSSLAMCSLSPYRQDTDGRSLTAGINESMLSIETLAKTLLLQLHQEKERKPAKAGAALLSRRRADSLKDARLGSGQASRDCGVSTEPSQKHKSAALAGEIAGGADAHCACVAVPVAHSPSRANYPDLGKRTADRVLRESVLAKNASCQDRRVRHLRSARRRTIRVPRKIRPSQFPRQRRRFRQTPGGRQATR
jgi:hypothetical protein